MGSFDYVIVGAGSAGCVLANRLSADADKRVLLLEAGGSDNWIWFHIPIGYLYAMGNPRADWCWRTRAEPGLNGRDLAYPRGKVLGGCSAINGMIYMRGQAQDYDSWRQAGNVGWGWDDVVPYFKASEDYAHGADDLHGTGGPLRVEESRVRWKILDVFANAVAEQGLPKLADFNCGDNEGVSYFQVNQRAGVRWSCARGFLRPVAKRANLRVLTHALAERIELADGRPVALIASVNGARQRIVIEGELILSSGAIGSPVLLERSGIGQPDVLTNHGIETQHALAGIGENLQDHLQLRMIYKVQGIETLNEIGRGMLGKARIAVQYAMTRSGPMSMAPSQLGVFARSSSAYDRANLEYHVQPLSLDTFGDPLHDFPAFTASVCNLRPVSRGHVHLSGTAVTDQPEIAPNYLQAPEDRAVAADALRLTRRIVLHSKTFAPYRPSEYKPGLGADDDDSLAHAAGDIGTTIFHPVGTCKMGPASDQQAVVDDRLRVHGLRRLRVVDASIMPTITSGNTNAPVVMIAEKAAAMIREDARSGQT
ncbi:MAG: GMC family oxidoreductase [Geminicoccaceae bacterium]